MKKGNSPVTIPIVTIITIFFWSGLVFGEDFALIRTIIGTHVDKSIKWTVQAPPPDASSYKLMCNNLSTGESNKTLKEINKILKDKETIDYRFSESGIYEIFLKPSVGNPTASIIQIIGPNPSEYSNESDYVDTSDLDEKFENYECDESAVYDVIVVDGTSAGVGAAITAAKEGLRTCLLESSDLIGGMFTNGIGKTDIGLGHIPDPDIPDDKFGDLGLGLTFGLMEQLRSSVPPDQRYGKNDLKFRPSVMRKALYTLIDEQVGVDNNGLLDIQLRSSFSRVESNGTESKFVIYIDGEKKYKTNYIIDATESGDVAVDPFFNAECLDGDCFSYDPNNPKQAYSFVMTVTNEANTDWSYMKIKPSSCGDECPEGAKDTNGNNLDGYNCYTEETLKDSWTYGSGKIAENTFQVKHHMPSDIFKYDEKTFWRLGYELIDNNEIRKDLEFDKDEIGLAFKKNNIDRQKIIERYLNHSVCFLFRMQEMDTSMNWRLTEYEDPLRGNFPARLYIREGRRIKGESIFDGYDASKNWQNLPEHWKEWNKSNGEWITLSDDEIKDKFEPECVSDCISSTSYEDRPRQSIDKISKSIGVVNYSMDIHSKSQEKIDDDPNFTGEVNDRWNYFGKKDYLIKFTGPGMIPIGVMIPMNKNGQPIENLLVPVAVSATERGYSTLRMDPARLQMGQAAAIAVNVVSKNGDYKRDKDISLHDLVGENGKDALFEIRKRLVTKYNSCVYLYNDLEGNHWAQKGLQFLIACGLLEPDVGFPGSVDNLKLKDDFKFGVEKEVTRAEFVTMAILAARKAFNVSQLPSYQSINYEQNGNDMKNACGANNERDCWYKPFMDEAYEAHIIKGDEGNNFDFLPEKQINRAEAAKILVKAFHFPDPEKRFNKDNSKLIDGYCNDNCNEKVNYNDCVECLKKCECEPCSSCEDFRNNCLNNCSSCQSIEIKSCFNPSNFTDVASKEWFCDYVALCKNYKIIKGYGEGDNDSNRRCKFGPENKIERAEAVKMIYNAYEYFTKEWQISNNGDGDSIVTKIRN